MGSGDLDCGPGIAIPDGGIPGKALTSMHLSLPVYKTGIKTPHSTIRHSEF